MGFMNMITNVLNDNLNISLEYFVLICLFLSSFVIFAYDFKVGLIWTFLTNTMAFTLMYAYNYNWGIFLSTALISLVLLALTFYVTLKSSRQGSII